MMPIGSWRSRHSNVKFVSVKDSRDRLASVIRYTTRRRSTLLHRFRETTSMCAKQRLCRKTRHQGARADRSTAHSITLHPR
eukprot:3576512-Amphidinium_carterae.2